MMRHGQSVLSAWRLLHHDHVSDSYQIPPETAFYMVRDVLYLPQIAKLPADAATAADGSSSESTAAPMDTDTVPILPSAGPSSAAAAAPGTRLRWGQLCDQC